MLSTLSSLFFLCLATGIVVSLLVVRRTDLQAHFFRLNVLIAVLLLGGALYFAPASIASGTRNYLWVLLVLGLLYSQTVLILSLLMERFILLVMLIGLSMALWQSVHALNQTSVSPVLDFISMWIGGVVMGEALIAMNVGHSYLAMKRLTIRPLRHSTAALGAMLGLRTFGLLVVVPILLLQSKEGAAEFARVVSMENVTLLSISLVRILFGVIGPLILTYMTWETVKIRSTQSATGILYAVLAMVLIGEASAYFIILNTSLPA